MSRKWLLSLISLFASALLLSTAADAKFDVSVDEASTTVSFQELAPTVSLNLNNGHDKLVTVVVSVELLTPSNKSIGSTETAVVLKSGRQQVQISLPLKSRDYSPANNSETLWYRLHYRVTPEASTPIEGFISLSEITPELFELRVAASPVVPETLKYIVRVHAAHPFTNKPTKGVDIRASATITDDSDLVVTASATTGSDGYADLAFQLPANQPIDELELEIEGRRGAMVVTATEDLQLLLNKQILISTDKPIYRPGQTVHTRALVLGHSRRPIANKNVTVKITDADDAVVFSTDLVTSRFGIVTAEWKSPEHIKLGEYRIQFQTNDEQTNDATINITRYELPNFVVDVKSDRSYYLRGEDATLTVHANYLFGEPVVRGHVRLVRQKLERWDSTAHKYTTKPEATFEGQLKPDGTFTVRLPLTEEFNTLLNPLEDSDSLFDDVEFYSYVTDASTNRTEQRRFNIRLTKEAIHVYAILAGKQSHQNGGLPLTYYLSTFYADGTPAQCEVIAKAIDSDDETTGDQEKIITRFRTNRYGLAKMSHASSLVGENSSITLRFSAKDRSGRSGSKEQTFEIEDGPGIRIATSKTVFAPQEPIEVTIASTEPDLVINLDVVRNWTVLQSRSVRIRNGRASLLIPYTPEFKQEVTLMAYWHRSKDAAVSPVRASRSVIYPSSRDLKINLRVPSTTYKPGETARIYFKTTSPTQTHPESVLGIVAVDKAVDARVMTDLKPWQRYGSFFDEALILNGHGDSLGSVSRNSLENLDLSKLVPADLDLAAEILLNQDQSYWAEVFTSDNFSKDYLKLFGPHINHQMEELRKVLTDTYSRTAAYPRDEPTLRRLLEKTKVSLETLIDPWGKAYRPLFYTERQLQLFWLESAGPDKRFDTNDDFTVTRLSWPYFQSTGELIDKAVNLYHQRTGQFIRDFATLQTELLTLGLDLNTLKDPWQKPYRFSFDINETEVCINVKTSESSEEAEFWVWRSRINHFTLTRAKITAALNELYKTGRLPETRSGMRDALLPAGIDIDNLYDLWRNKYYLVFTKLPSSQPNIERAAFANSNPDLAIFSVSFRSVGPDGLQETDDDFEVVGLASILSEGHADVFSQRRFSMLGASVRSTGIIRGTVVDAAGAIVSGATVSLVDPQTREIVASDTTNESGRYVLRSVTPGIYRVRVQAPGFMLLEVSQVEVNWAEILELNLNLQVASVAETVTVSAAADSIVTQSATTASTVVKNVKSLPGARSVSAKRAQPFITPRLREFFPETLIWKPEVVTDSSGRATLDLKLADNITTWRLSVIGSNEHGEVGVAETEIRTFQPFFAELDPPQVLTQGDQISLPVIVRNYLDTTQAVDLQLKPEQWFTVVSKPKKKISVPGRDSSTQFFDIQATSSITSGKQRVTAVGTDFSDAIEKSTAVHPDGEEKSVSVGDLLRESTSLSLELPPEMIDNSARVELKIYPNLMGHVLESVEAIMQRPYGCGEQTISSTYPSLLVLRYLNQTDKASSLAQKANRYLEEGYQRLLGYRSPDGGFRYWQHGNADVALTAYAIRFLQDASDLIEIDQEVIDQAQLWLSKQQQPNGTWTTAYSSHDASSMLTALVARALATDGSCKLNGDGRVVALQKALNYLERPSAISSEPYLIASYSIAASAACQPERAAAANARLRLIAQRSSSGVHWLLGSNTPFYGWGRAGHIETTALAIQALSQSKTDDRVNFEANSKLIDGALLFLLKEKDHYGVWHTTQATINVLNTLLRLLPAQIDGEKITARNVDVVVNGRKTSVELPKQTFVAPVAVDISDSLQPGINTIRLEHPSTNSIASVQLAGTYWVPWTTANKSSAESQSLRLEATCDKTEARVMEEITCNVQAQRLGSGRYGMMLAEIGLPPGADVDRASLEALKRSSSGIDQFDVLPDRLIFYFWPRSAATKFSYKFRPRMAMNAQSAASLLYDYYNPEARVTLRPVRFIVK